MIAVPRSRAKPTISSDGRLPLLTIRSDAPSSMARRCASVRLPTTTASPGAIFVGASTCHRVHPHPAGDAVVALAGDQLALEHVGDEPAVVGASARVDASRDSRM